MSKYTDDDIRAYDNVPIVVAADYLGAPPDRLRKALQNTEYCFLGLAVGGSSENGKTMFIISPGALVKWKNGTMFLEGKDI